LKINATSKIINLFKIETEIKIKIVQLKAKIKWKPKLFLKSRINVSEVDMLTAYETVIMQYRDVLKRIFCASPDSSAASESIQILYGQ